MARSVGLLSEHRRGGPKVPDDDYFVDGKGGLTPRQGHSVVPGPTRVIPRPKVVEEGPGPTGLRVTGPPRGRFLCRVKEEDLGDPDESCLCNLSRGEGVYI